MNLSVWHIVIGFFFSNGMPHFIVGVAGKRFRSPLGPNSSARINLVWGLTNFVLTRRWCCGNRRRRNGKAS